MYAPGPMRFGPGASSFVAMSALPGSRRELAVDIAVVAVVFVALLIDGQFGEHGSGITVVGTVAAIGASAPLLFRRRAPVAALAVATPFVFWVNETLEPYDAVMLVPAVALFSVALYGDRRRSLLALAVIVPLVIIGVVATGESAFGGIALQNIGWVLLATVAGDALRSRRAAAAGQRERRAIELREAKAEAESRLASERLEIAREVHDVVAHSMVAINVQAGTAAHLLENHPEQAEGALREIKRVSGEALVDLRATLGILRDETGSAPTQPSTRLMQLSQLVQPLRASGVEVEVEVSGPAAAVPTAVGNAAYRIVQEALTNVVRHASATHAAVRVGIGGETVDVEVIDDGTGSAEGAAAGTGNGLRGMRERAAAIGGSVESGGLPGGGWRVHATLPLRVAAP